MVLVSLLLPQYGPHPPTVMPGAEAAKKQNNNILCMGDFHKEYYIIYAIPPKMLRVSSCSFTFRQELNKLPIFCGFFVVVCLFVYLFIIKH